LECFRCNHASLAGNVGTQTVPTAEHHRYSRVHSVHQGQKTISKLMAAASGKRALKPFIRSQTALLGHVQKLADCQAFPSIAAQKPFRPYAVSCRDTACSPAAVQQRKQRSMWTVVQLSDEAGCYQPRNHDVGADEECQHGAATM